MRLATITQSSRIRLRAGRLEHNGVLLSPPEPVMILSKLLAQLKDKFPTEKPEKLDQALKDANGNYLQAVQSLNATPIHTSSSPMQQHTPNKLQKPEQRQRSNPHPNSAFSAASIHPNHQLMPFPAGG